MSLESDIEEILDESEEDVNDKTYLLNDKQINMEEAVEKLLENKSSSNNVHEHPQSVQADFNENNRDTQARHKDRKSFTDDIDTKTIAIVNYSNCLAENVLKEALLITDIHAKDSQDRSDAVDEEAMERDKGIRRQLFPTENGRINASDTRGGYDSYLLNKLLSSRPDPSELGGTEGFDGNEDHFKIGEEGIYPGLDKGDEYVKEELERSNAERLSSDQNNNKSDSRLLDHPSVIVDNFDDNAALQTIHEDRELVIEGSFPSNSECAENTTTRVNHDKTEAVTSSADDQRDADKLSPGDEAAEERSCNNDSGNVEDLQEPLDADADENGEAGLSEIVDDHGESEDDEEEKANDDETVKVELELDEISDDSDDEPDCCEMTLKEKKAMVHAVRRGDIDLLESLLEKRNADINMLWYGETLLMEAIRAQQKEMSEFLIDNGVDWKHEKKLVELDEKGAISVHKIAAREMAYDLNQDDLVELLDQKMENLFPFIRPRPRIPRLRQPIIPFQPPPLDEGIKAEFFITPEEAKERQKEARKEHFERLRQAAIEAEQLELERINAQRRKRGLLGPDEEEAQMSKDLNALNDEISQVFGPDEGYETMSPVSHHPRYDRFHMHNMHEPVSIRGTRASHLKKAFNASKAGQLKRIESPDYPMYENHMIESIGSYGFESRRWHHPLSAPTYRNFSIESIPDTDVHIGLPFVHDKFKKSASARSRGRSAPASVPQRRAQSAHSNISPFSQVARLLEQSRLFNPVVSSRSSKSLLPAISSKRSADLALTRTRMNYIYANRGSATTRERVTHLKDELLPKRKVFAR